MQVLPTELLREAMDGARQLEASATGFGRGPLGMLESAIATAEAAEGVDGAMLQEAMLLLATKPLQMAMEQRQVAGLKAAIEVAEGEVAVDRTVVEVSGCLIWTRATHAWSRCNRWSHSTCRFTNSRL